MIYTFGQGHGNGVMSEWGKAELVLHAPVALRHVGKATVSKGIADVNKTDALGACRTHFVAKHEDALTGFPEPVIAECQVVNTIHRNS